MPHAWDPISGAPRPRSEVACCAWAQEAGAGYLQTQGAYLAMHTHWQLMPKATGNARSHLHPTVHACCAACEHQQAQCMAAQLQCRWPQMPHCNSLFFCFSCPLGSDQQTHCVVQPQHGRCLLCPSAFACSAHLDANVAQLPGKSLQDGALHAMPKYCQLTAAAYAAAHLLLLCGINAFHDHVQVAQLQRGRRHLSQRDKQQPRIKVIS